LALTKVRVKNYSFSFSSSELNYVVQFPINPYGKAKKMAEDIILDFSKSKKSDMAVMILRLDHSPREKIPSFQTII